MSIHELFLVSIERNSAKFSLEVNHLMYSEEIGADWSEWFKSRDSYSDDRLLSKKFVMHQLVYKLISIYLL